MCVRKKAQLKNKGAKAREKKERQRNNKKREKKLMQIAGTRVVCVCRSNIPFNRNYFLATVCIYRLEIV